MGKWLAGIIGGIIVGVAIWWLTTVLPERHKEKQQKIADERMEVSCTPDPPTVKAGEISELTIKVTQGGQPAADVPLRNGMEDYGTTASDGTARIQWHAPPSAYSGGTRFRIEADATARGGGYGAGDCQIMYKS